ncbi:MAG: MFS transporter [Peptostreptococcaceae bacterium]|nr:MFS transporter [Peptostreptococcaceae bacterium]
MFHLPKNKRSVAIIAGLIGNIVEWYDFALYGFMAVIISRLFFPSDYGSLSLFATYGIFASGFVMRPIGAGLFGWIGDTYGRSKTMIISVAMMMIPTFALGLLPTYKSIGIFAPILLVLIRLIQGLSVGGEFSSSVTYLVETSPPKKRGLSGSWANVGSGAGMLLGSLAASLATNFFSDATLMAWGWRVPFLFGGILGGFSVMLRKNLPKSPHFVENKPKERKTSPIKEVFSKNLKETMQGMIFASGYGALFYLIMVYLPTWLNEYNGFLLKDVMKINTVATAEIMLLIPLMGWISDRFIKRTHFVSISIVMIAIISFPMMMWLKGGSMISAWVAQLVLALFMAVISGVAPTMFAELFPSRDRRSGYSISFNVGMGMIGGSTPMIVTWLISKTNITLIPAAYIVFWSFISLIGLFWMTDRSREPLR